LAAGYVTGEDPLAPLSRMATCIGSGSIASATTLVPRCASRPTSPTTKRHCCCAPSGGCRGGAGAAADRCQPGVVSTELAPRLDLERLPFKQRVRRLKELGLTESLKVGYRLSPAARPCSTGSSHDSHST